MAKSGTYRIAYTYVNKNAAGTVTYETGRSPVFGPATITGTASVGGSYSTNARITHVRIWSTMSGGSVYYFEKDIANNTAGGQGWTTVSESDSVLQTRATAYWTGKGYEAKRLYEDGVQPPVAYVVEAAGRLWGCGRMHTGGTNEDATLWWSELAPNWCDWPSVNGASKFAASLTGLYEFNELVYAFTRDSRWKVTPETYNEGMAFEKLEGNAGCLGHHTIQKIGAAVVWFGQDGVYATVGDEVPVLLSGAIRDTIKGIDKNRARFGVSHWDPETQEYELWLSTEGSVLNDLCIVGDFSDGLENPKWTIRGGHGRSVFYVISAVGPNGERIKLYGDHLGCVWQEVSSAEADGATDGGTYMGVLSYCTTSSTTTSTSTTT